MVAYRDRYRRRPSADPLVLLMRSANEADIAALQAELAEARSEEGRSAAQQGAAARTP